MFSTILGSVLGFAGSAIGPAADYFTAKNNQKFEIKKLEKASELAKAGFTQEQVMFSLKAQGEEHDRLLTHDTEMNKYATGFVGSLQRLVRPLITYCFFGLFAMVEITLVNTLIDGGMNVSDALQLIWDDNTQAIFATIISFWFGNRYFEKKNERIQTKQKIT